MVLQECAQNEMDYDELYELMISVADDFEIPNPFPDKERFLIFIEPCRDLMN